MGKSRSPDPYVNCPYDCKMGAVSTEFRRCERLSGAVHWYTMSKHSVSTRGRYERPYRHPMRVAPLKGLTLLR